MSVLRTRRRRCTASFIIAPPLFLLSLGAQTHRSQTPQQLDKTRWVVVAALCLSLCAQCWCGTNVPRAMSIYCASLSLSLPLSLPLPTQLSPSPPPLTLNIQINGAPSSWRLCEAKGNIQSSLCFRARFSLPLITSSSITKLLIQFQDHDAQSAGLAFS